MTPSRIEDLPAAETVTPTDGEERLGTGRRQDLINRLVARKMDDVAAGARPICICMARPKPGPPGH